MAYCASCITGSSESGNDQDTYIRALQKTESLDHVEFGNFVERVNIGPLAVEGPNRRPSLVDPSQLQVVGDTPGIRITSDRVLVSYSRREEKGSDVNVASHLLIDVYDARIDAALVVSNDSDLEFAVRCARTKVPVGMVNPSRNRLAGKLKDDGKSGISGHFSTQLTVDDFKRSQLPPQVGALTRPKGW